MRTVIAVLAAAGLFCIAECACVSFTDLILTAIPVKGNNFEVTVNGCISPQIFGGKALKGLYARNQIIWHLYKDSITNFDQLEQVSFDACSVEKLDAGAFSNAPRLSEIFVVKSRISEVPSGVFSNLPSLTKVRLHNNAIKVIQPYAFANIPTLKKIYLAHNYLTYLDPSWFANSTAIEKLDFEFNAIENIPRSAFRGLPNLSVLNLNFNNISLIEPDAFGGLSHLKYLGLRHNRLALLDPAAFPQPLLIDSLFIDANRFSYIPSNTLANLVVKNITLDGNPWTCPCLEYFGGWLRSINGTVKASKYCRGLDIMQCIHLEPFHHSYYSCKEVADNELTQLYFDAAKVKLSQTNQSLTYNYCVRLYK